MNERDDILEQLTAYLDGELPPEQVRDVESKLQSDPSLAQELERLRHVTALVRGLPRERPGADFTARVLAQAERSTLVGKHRHEREKGPLFWVRYAAVAALVLIFFGVAGIVVKTLNSPDFRDRVASKTTEPISGGDLARDLRESGNKKGERLQETDKSSAEPESDVAKIRAGKRFGEDREPVGKALAKGEVAVAETPAPVVVAAPREETGQARALKGNTSGLEVAAASPVHAKAARSSGKGGGWDGAREKPAGGIGGAGKPDSAVAGNDMAEEVDVAAEEVIWTDNLQVASADVEKVLQRNGITVAAGTFSANREFGANNAALDYSYQAGGQVVPAGQGSADRQAPAAAPMASQAPRVAPQPSRPATLSKSGSGTLEVNGANTYTGATTVTAGVLKEGLQSLNARSRVNLPSGQSANSYNVSNASPNQFQYYVYVPAEQVPKLQHELNTLRNSTRYNQIAANMQLGYQSTAAGGLGGSGRLEAKQAKDAAPSAPTAGGARNDGYFRKAPATSQAASAPVQQGIAAAPSQKITLLNGGSLAESDTRPQQALAQQDQSQRRASQRESLQALVITVNGLPVAANQAPAEINRAKIGPADAAKVDSSRPASK